MVIAVQAESSTRPAHARVDPILVALGVAAGALAAVLGGRGALPEIAGIVMTGFALPAILLFLFRPHVVLAAYLFALPLVVPFPTGLGLNAGEAVTIGVLTFGTMSLWDGRGRIPGSMRALAPVMWPLGGLVLVSLISLLVNGLTGPGDFVSALFKVVAFGYAAFLVHLHANTAERAKALLRALVAGGVCVAVYSIAAYLLGWSYSDEYDWNRPMGTLENWNLLGSYMALMSMPTLGLAATSRSVPARLTYGAGFVLQITAMLLSLTLGSVLGLLVGGGAVALFLMRRGWRRVLPAVMLAAIPVAIVVATNPVLRDKIVNVDERVLDRLRTYAVGVAMFRDKAWFGFGTEQRVLEELRFGESDYGLTAFGESSSMAHNSFIQIGVEKGIFGAAVFTVLIGGVLVLLLRHRRAFERSRLSALYYASMAGAFAFLVQNLTNVLVLHARLGVLFLALVVILERMGAGLAGEGRDVVRRVGVAPGPAAGR